MDLSFFTKCFGRSVQLSSSFGKTFSYVRDACKYKDKVYEADIYRINYTCTSCVFNGFKYIILVAKMIKCSTLPRILSYSSIYQQHSCIAGKHCLDIDKVKPKSS